MVLLHLRASKTDPFREGITMQVHATDNDLCPVAHLLAYLTVRDKLCQSPQAPFFMLPGLIPLTRQQFNTYLNDTLLVLNLSHNNIKPHSFRIGAATSAAEAGVPDHLLKTLGRWSSNCYQRYIRTPSSLIHQAQNSMSYM
jgi:hypothetical protein